MSRAAVYALPARYEPFGLAPLEAALTGCALLMADIPTFRELWEGCAVFYPTGDSDALAESATELIRDPARCRALGSAARQRALEQYTPERMAERYEVLYREMLERSPEPVIAD